MNPRPPREIARETRSTMFLHAARVGSDPLPEIEPPRPFDTAEVLRCVGELTVLSARRAFVAVHVRNYAPPRWYGHPLTLIRVMRDLVLEVIDATTSPIVEFGAHPDIDRGLEFFACDEMTRDWVRRVPRPTFGQHIPSLSPLALRPTIAETRRLISAQGSTLEIAPDPFAGVRFVLPRIRPV